MKDSSELLKFPIYMDNHATTQLDNRVLKEMLPYFTKVFGNAASIDHTFGLEANKAVENSRIQISKQINCKPDEIIFTSGATESDNLAIQGVVKKYKEKGNHIITSVTEHKAVLDTCKYLEETENVRVTYLPVDKYGKIDINIL
jgi:cysteine desulfurase